MADEKSKPNFFADTVNPAAHKAASETIGVPSQLDAFGIGVRSGVTAGFSDELVGLSHAGKAALERGHDTLGLPKWLKYVPGAKEAAAGVKLGIEKASGKPGVATEAYEKGRAQEKAAQEAAEKAFPATHTAGDIAGGFMVPAGGMAAQGTRLAGRMLAGARIGGLQGLISGVGHGEGDGRWTGGAIGAGVGTVLGATAAPALAALRAGGGLLARATGMDRLGAIQSLWALDKVAEKKIGQKFLDDAETGSLGLQGPAPLVNVDAGGESVRALLRSATNTSPQARNIANQHLEDRFAGQTDRAVPFIQNLGPHGARSPLSREELKQAARVENNPAYRKAYAAGDRPIISDELEALSGSDAVKQAAQDAVKRGKDRAIADGFGAFNPGFVVTPDGRLLMNSKSGVPTYPNIQFWDYVQRELSDQIATANPSMKSTLTTLHTRLRNELDKIVPEFGEARRGAAAFFKSENAIDAGKEFVTMEMSKHEAQAAIRRMTRSERALFQDSFAHELADRVSKMSDRADIVNRIYHNKDMKERIEMALGTMGAARLQMFLHRERIMDLSRKALGNSTTARQLMEIGAAGGAGASVDSWMRGGGVDTRAIATGMVIGGVLGGRQIINNRLALRITEMLFSNDPALVNRAITIAAQNREAGAIVRSMEHYLEKMGGQSAGEAAGEKASK